MNRFTSFLRLCTLVVLLTGILFQNITVYAASLPAEINKQFTPLQISAGGVSVMRVTIFNPNSYPLTNASWTDDLVGVQAGLFIANPAGIVNTCGGAVTGVAGTDVMVTGAGGATGVAGTGAATGVTGALGTTPTGAMGVLNPPGGGVVRVRLLASVA